MKHNTSHNIRIALGNVLIVLIVLFAMVQILPGIKVLTNWKLTVDSNQKYMSGDKITLVSSFVKHYGVNAQSDRNLECKTTAGGVATYVIYYGYSPSKQTGPHTNKTVVYIPPISQPKPAQCRIIVDLHYVIWGVKPINQQNSSNYFWIVQ